MRASSPSHDVGHAGFKKVLHRDLGRSCLRTGLAGGAGQVGVPVDESGKSQAAIEVYCLFGKSLELSLNRQVSGKDGSNFSVADNDMGELSAARACDLCVF